MINYVHMHESSSFGHARKLCWFKGRASKVTICELQLVVAGQQLQVLNTLDVAKPNCNFLQVF